MKSSSFLSTGVVAVLVALPFAAAAGEAKGRVELDLSGPGWKLWQDTKAKWERGPLFPPPVDVAKVLVNPPPTGLSAIKFVGQDVSVPGTVEEYLHPGNGPEGDIKGVSWWMRNVTIPTATSPRRLRLHFDAVRLRAEVFVNRKLVGYDLVGNSPFDVDITDAAKPGEECELAVRVTDPGGNFDWRDTVPFAWGRYLIPMSHGFGGITGRVRLTSCDPVYVDDIYVQNTPAITKANVIATVRNATKETVRRDVVVTVAKRHPVDDGHVPPNVFVAKFPSVELAPGDQAVTCKVSVASAQRWDLDNPNLYVCEVALKDGNETKDTAQQTFGFRWFAPEGIGSNAVFRLNGKRVVLRTAISWGFWPINGIYPTQELAEKEIRSAKALGQNMLNFHRCIGHPEVLDEADELGLLIYEEPGAYVDGDRTPFTKALVREKLLRMVKRDRSHPSLVIYNMINEAWDSGGARTNKVVFAGHVRDMRDMYALDPSRTITYTSAWAKRAGADELPKMHMRPFDDVIHVHGWFDTHHAGGPEVWRQNFYSGPDQYYNRTTNRNEIVYWGEEGAISAPPRLEKIKAALEAAPNKGWDGAVYLDWYRQFDEFLARKDLCDAFPTVDALTISLGAVSHYHQARKIETLRIDNTSDGYAVNGWESEIVENHSGIVDCFRNPKADPAIMAYYNQPLYVAVKTRSQFAQIPDAVVVDFYAINEKNVKGPYTLKIWAKDPSGREVFAQTVPVSLAGGDVFGQLLQDNVTVPIVGATGIFRVEASLRNATDGEVAAGHDEVLAVDWKSEELGGKGATWEGAPLVRDFLEAEKGLKVEAYRDTLGPLDWIVVTRPPGEGEAVEIPYDRFQSPGGDKPSLTTTFYSDNVFSNQFFQRGDRTIDLFVPEGGTADQAMGVTENYGVRWEGRIVPPTTGIYTLATESSGGVRLWVNGQLLFDDFTERRNQINRGRIQLEANKPVAVRLEFWHKRGNAQCKLLWAPPETDVPEVARLMERVRRDGTTLLILDRADTWMNLIQQNTSAKCTGSFRVGTTWLGGLHFVREHPLFKDLPVNTAMNWPYQAVVRNGKTRSGLLLEGEELVVGAWHSYPMALGTAVGIIPCGKGRIIVSTLDIASQLRSADTSAHVARKLLCNFLAFCRPPS